MSKRLLGELELNRIYQRDCIEGMRIIPDKSIDMILCDLPYGTTACKWDTIIPFEPLWTEYERIIKDNGAIVLTASQPFTTALISSNIKLFRCSWYWNKEVGGNFANARYHPMKVIEDVCVFSKKRVNYYPIMEEAEGSKIRPLGQSARSGDMSQGMASGIFKPADNYDPKKRYPKNLLTFNSRKGELNPLNRLHPTQKPVDLFEYLIRTYTNEGDVVLDNCMGSGTTAIAALRTGRQFIGFELEREYVEIANKRIDNELEAN